MTISLAPFSELAEAILGSIPDAVVVIGADGRIEHATEPALGLFGYSRDELLGQQVEVLVPDVLRSDHHKLRAQFLRAPVERPMHAVPTVAARRKDGTEFSADISLRTVDLGGRPVIIAVVRDATARLSAERALRDGEARLSAIIETEPECVKLLSREGILLEMNAAGLRMVEADTLAQVQGRDLLPIVAEAHRSAFAALTKRVFDGESGILAFEIVGLKGGHRWLETHATPLRDASGRVTALLSVTRDITEHRRLEDQSLRSQRIEATGRLAAGVAHDFNNILTVILAGCELAAAELDSDSDAGRDLLQVTEAAKRGGALTQQLLAFTRQQTIRPRLLDLKAHLHDVVGILRRTISAQITVEVGSDGNHWPVLMDPAQVDQVMLNLMVNSRDAMPDGGSLRIDVTDIALDASHCAGREGLSPGAHVRLRVKDSGRGIDPATLKRVFEPFFTTKPQGLGTGLGLSSVYGIVKQNRGYVEVASVVGEGTTVTIFLPAAPDAKIAATGPTKTTLARGSERVLLVEDDDRVRHVTRRLLETLGYSVRESADPIEALHHLDTDDEAFDLLLTDMVMPGMNGRELAQHVVARRPDLPTLYMSGYAPGGESGPRQSLAGEDNFLQKPFELSELAAAVQRAIHSRARR